MSKRRAHLILLVSTSTLLACLFSSFGNKLKAPEGSDVPDLPLYSNAKNISVADSDIEMLITDFFGEEFVEYEYSTNISWTEDIGRDLENELNESLPEAKWRIEEDWYNYSLLRISEWRIGDVHALVAYLDNLDSEHLKDLNRRYGISDPETGSTLIIVHIVDDTQPK